MGRIKESLDHWRRRDRRRERLREDESTLVDRLYGTPYENLPRATGVLPAAEAERVMDVALRLGRQMFLCGSETATIEYTLIAVTDVLGLTYLDVDITGRSIHLQHHPPGERPLVLFRVTKSEDTRDLNRMSAVDAMIREIVFEGMTLEDAERALDRVEHVPPALPWWLMLAGGGVLAASISLQAGGTPLSALVAVLIRVVVDRVGWSLGGRLGLPTFYVVGIQAFIAVGTGIFGSGLGWWSGQEAASMAAANLVLLLPILAVVSLAQDAITGFTLMAASRIVTVAMVLAGMLVGAVLVSTVFRDLDLAHSELITLVSMPLWVVLLACAVGALGNALLMGGALRLIPVAVLAGAVAGVVNTVGNRVLGLTSPMAVLLASILLGIGAAVLGERLRVPRAAIFVPGITGALLPGPDMYRTLVMYAANMEGAGPAVLLTLTTTAAIGAGIVLGDVLGNAANLGYARRRGRRARIAATSAEPSEPDEADGPSGAAAATEPGGSAGPGERAGAD
ncbi:threonine/serine exporter family protein [Nocardiopsis protaetiae]|uniref:threonine/serine ThrE exporter family protein n=1 Tax=Nocardiopsis protaetiae TaxID=3382270 RepID=UPI00387B784C